MEAAGYCSQKFGDLDHVQQTPGTSASFPTEALAPPLLNSAPRSTGAQSSSPHLHRPAEKKPNRGYTGQTHPAAFHSPERETVRGIGAGSSPSVLWCRKVPSSAALLASPSAPAL